MRGLATFWNARLIRSGITEVLLRSYCIKAGI